MFTKMITLDRPIIVEGKYDKIKLQSVVDAPIIATNGFSIFKDKEKMNYIRKLADKNGIIILTDSDSAGFMIRNHISSCVNKDKITNVYIPDVFGREKRKTKYSAEGKLGVEGIDKEVLIKAFEKSGVFSNKKEQEKKKITKSDLFFYGLSGKDNSKENRALLLKKLDLPENMTSNSLLDALNVFLTFDEFDKICKELFE